MSLLVQVGCCGGSRIVGSPCIMKLTYFLFFTQSLQALEIYEPVRNRQESIFSPTIIFTFHFGLL